MEQREYLVSVMQMNGGVIGLVWRVLETLEVLREHQVRGASGLARGERRRAGFDGGGRLARSDQPNHEGPIGEEWSMVG